MEVCPSLAAIEAFREPGSSSWANAGDPGDPMALEGAGHGEGEVVYRGPVWIGAAERPAVCRRSPAGYGVDIEGVGSIEVASDGAHARVCPPADVGPDEGLSGVLAEAALGPALVLALALRGTFCLHASAVVLPGRTGEPSEVVAFLGPSGAGKSTLARLLDDARPGWLRAADDVLPVVWSAEGPHACVRFPQLKIPEGAQPGARVPEALPLTALYLLVPPTDRSGARRRSPVGCRRLSQRDAVLALVRNTVAARLFDGGLLERHLDLCARFGARPGVAELGYPWCGEVVPGLTEAIVSGTGAA